MQDSLSLPVHGKRQQQATEQQTNAPRRSPVTRRQERVYSLVFALHKERNWSGLVATERQAWAVATELWTGRPVVAVSILTMLGDGFSHSCQTVKAIRLLEQSQILAADAGDMAGLRSVCTTLGFCFQAQGQYGKAIELHEQSRAISVKLRDRVGQAKASNNLGNVHSSLNHHGKAKELLEHALAIQDDLGDRLGHAQTLFNLSRCHCRQQQYREAIACLKQCWPVYEELGEVCGQARAALQVGAALWAQAQTEDFGIAPAGASRDFSPSACAVQDAEIWLRKALALAISGGIANIKQDAQMHLACLAYFNGEEDEALALLAQYLQGWVIVGRSECVGCGQVRGEDLPMLRCDGCHVARYYRTTHDW